MHSHIPIVMCMQCFTCATHSHFWPTMSCIRVVLIKASLNRPHTSCMWSYVYSSLVPRPYKKRPGNFRELKPYTVVMSQ